MDSLSQIVLGGAVGEAVLGKKVGNKSIFWGAIAGTIPDLDTIPGQFMDTVSRLSIHRGFSHSIVFAVLMAPLLAWVVRRIYKKDKGTYWGWTQLFFWGIFTHPLLDIFTTWGTQLFWPLDWRIALHSIFVIDPLYTLPFLICLLVVLFLNRKSPLRTTINYLGIGLSSTYLAWTLVAKLYVDHKMEDYIKRNEIEVLSYQSRPTPFNTILWTFNIEQETAFIIKYYSLLDEEIEEAYFEIEKNHHLLRPYRNHSELEQLIFLTKGYYCIEPTNGGLLMHDLRFGMVDGLDEQNDDFVFTYLLQMKQGELEITQVEQSFKGTSIVLKNLWDRLKGIKSA